jgi:hypothetical protein
MREELQHAVDVVLLKTSYDQGGNHVGCGLRIGEPNVQGSGSSLLTC